MSAICCLAVVSLTSLSARRAWIEIDWAKALFWHLGSLSARRAWIEIFAVISLIYQQAKVALRKESVDRNICPTRLRPTVATVALRKESVDRNGEIIVPAPAVMRSLSARRAWIEIGPRWRGPVSLLVALRKESVDRNPPCQWRGGHRQRRSPQGERG